MTAVLTQAGAALKQLQDQLVKVADSGRVPFNSYDHIMVCHGCGVFHAVRSCFISTPVGLAFSFEDGSNLTIGGSGCPECMKTTPSPIRDAWENGIKRATHDRAADSIGAKRWPEPVPCSICGAGDHPRNLSNGAHGLCSARQRRGLPTPALEVKYR